MNGTSGQTSRIADIVGVANQAALQWYATVTQRPIATGQPPTLMRNVFGTDFAGGPTVIGQTAGTIGPLLLIGIVVLGIVLVVRR